MLGFDLNVFVGSSLIRLYAAVVATIMHDVCFIKCLPQRDYIVWNILLNGLLIVVIL